MPDYTLALFLFSPLYLISVHHNLTSAPVMAAHSDGSQLQFVEMGLLSLRVMAPLSGRGKQSAYFNRTWHGRSVLSLLSILYRFYTVCIVYKCRMYSILVQRAVFVHYAM